MVVYFESNTYILYIIIINKYILFLIFLKVHVFLSRLYSTITQRVLIDNNLKKHQEMAKLLKDIAWYMIKHITVPFIQVSKHIIMNSIMIIL